MRASEIRTLFEYNFWANHRLQRAAAKLTAEQFVASGNLSHGGLRSTFCHMLSGDYVWRVRCQTGQTPKDFPPQEVFPTLDSLLDRWNSEEQAMRSFLAGLRDEDLAAPVRYQRGEKVLNDPLWQILLHLLNHGTQTRSEAALLLTELGQSPGDIDLIIYFWRYAQSDAPSA